MWIKFARYGHVILVLTISTDTFKLNEGCNKVLADNPIARSAKPRELSLN